MSDLDDPGWLAGSTPSYLEAVAAFGREPRIAVLLHLYYTDLWNEIIGYIRRIPVDFDLYASLTEGSESDFPDVIRHDFPMATVVVMPNRGRDILPFHRLLQQAVQNRNYDFICKIHTKKTPYWHRGDEWRRALLEAILGQREQVSRILINFMRRPGLGLVAADDVLVFASAKWDADGLLLRQMRMLLGKMNIEYHGEDFVFAGGTMFWCRLSSLSPLMNLSISDQSFEEEQGQCDGLQLANSYERLLGYLVFRNGDLIAGARCEGFQRFDLENYEGQAVSD